MDEVQLWMQIKLRKVHILLLVIIILSLLKISNVVPITSNQIITYEHIWNYKSLLTTEDNKTQEIYFQRMIYYFVRVDDIDNQTGIIHYTKWDSYGDEEKIERNITAEGMDRPYIFFPYFVDDELRGIVFHWFFLFGESRYFIEPDWRTINGILLETSFNQEGGSPWGGPGTVGEFLTRCKSYTLMGETDLEGARDKLNNNPRKWSGLFIVDDEMYYGTWDQTLLENVYLPYKKYEWMFSLEYSQDGILENMFVTKKLEREELVFEETHLLTRTELNEHSETSDVTSPGFEWLLTLLLPSVLIMAKKKRRCS